MQPKVIVHHTEVYDETEAAGGGGLTPAQAAKLAGIDAGAEVNAPRIVKFAAEDSDWGAQSSELEFAIGNADIADLQSIKTADTIRIANLNAAFGQDAAAVNADLDAVDVRPFFQDRLDNGGRITMALSKYGSSDHTYVQAETIAAISGGYALTNLTWAGAAQTRRGVGWNIVAGDDLVFAGDIPDLSANPEGAATGLLTKLLLGAVVYRLGAAWADITGKPTIPDAEQIRIDEFIDDDNVSVMDGYSIVASYTGSVNGTSIFSVNTYSIYYVDEDGVSRVEFLRHVAAGWQLLVHRQSTPPQYVFSDITGVEWEDENGDATTTLADARTFKFTVAIDSERGLDAYGELTAGAIRLHWKLPLDHTYALLDGSNVTPELVEAIQGSNEDEALGTFTRVAAGLEQVGDNRFSVGASSITFSVASDTDYALETSSTNDAKLWRAAKERAWIRFGNGWEVEIVALSQRYLGSGNRAQYLITSWNVIRGTAPGVNSSTSVTIIGEDVHRGQIVTPAFRENSPNVEGAGGSQWDLWTRGSGSENAAWQALSALASRIATALNALTGSARLSYASLRDTPTIPAAYAGPTQAGTDSDVGETWTNAATGLASGDFLYISMDGYYSSESGNVETRLIARTFGSIPTGGLWVTIRGGDGGSRFEIRRNGTNLQWRRQGSIGGTNSIIVYRA